jgi:hypothetical protein
MASSCRIELDETLDAAAACDRRLVARLIFP